MVNNELYINDQRVDLSGDNLIALAIQVNDLANLNDRQSTFSYNIKLPKTSNNCQIFGQAQSDAFTQNQPYKRLLCRLYQNGVEQIINGNASITSVDKSFNIQITYGLTGLSDALKKYTYSSLDPSKLESIEDAKLIDMDWSDIAEFNYDLNTIVASQTSVGLTSVLWPVIDYGDTLDTSSRIRTNFIRPGVYFAQIMSHIEKYTGYTFSGGKAYTDGLQDFIPFSATVLYDFAGNNYYTTHAALSVYRNLPDFTLKNFLKDFMQRYFLTPVVDNYKKTVVFHNFDELYENKPIARDWTNKFIDDDRSDEFSFGNYAQVNNFLWTKDQDYLIYKGDGILYVANENLETNRDLVTSIFSPSDTKKNVLGGQDVATIKKWSVVGSFPPDIDTSPRVVRIVDAKPGNYQFYDTGTDQFLYAPAKLGQFQPISWENQLNNYGTGLKRLLRKARAITRYANLTELDVQNFDFFTPVYDGREGKYYYVNKIPKFIAGKKTQLSLIRM